MKHFTIVALSVLALSVAAQSVALGAQAKSSASKAMSASGLVKSVSGNQLVVTASGKDMTFALDNSTKFTGKGLSTKSKGAPIAATDAVHEGDQVTVSYHDMGGTMHAASVRITASAHTAKK
ncbi:MAG TPA: hypothetical protein VKE51_27255 [Vicinamibacterales bacterium]|nr:hypothetical protein [Vicinamibacterales bacterium]